MTTSSMYSGDSQPVQVTITNAVTGAVVDLTGCTLTWELATAPGAAAIVTKTSTAGAITVGGDDDNVATVAILPADTDTLTAGIYHHELKVVDGAAQVHTAYQGEIQIKAWIVNPTP